MPPQNNWQGPTDIQGVDDSLDRSRNKSTPDICHVSSEDVEEPLTLFHLITGRKVLTPTFSM